MAQSQNKTRYRSLSIITFLVILFSFAYYYFVHVASKKQTFDEKAFRIIENVSDNIENKYKNYSKIVNLAHGDIVKNLVVSKSSKNKHITTQGQLRKAFDLKRVPNLLTVVSVDIDARKTADTAKFEIESFTTLRESLVVINSVKSTESDTNLLVQSEVSYKFDSLFTRVLPREFFEKYIVFSKSRVYYSDIAYDKFSDVNLDTLFFNDSKKGVENVFHSSDIAEVEFNDETQLLYITPINVGDSNSIFIAGIIEKSFYHQQAFQIETNTLTTLMVLLVILILSIPFIKILMMSNDERMHSSDAVNSFLVIVLGSSFVILSIVTLFTHAGPTLTEEKKYIEKYADAIERNFVGELNAVLSQIDTHENILRDSIASNNKRTPATRFSYDISYLLKDTAYSTKYRHLNQIFWANSKGDQLVKWSAKNITARVNLKFRSYFSVPNDSNQVLWNHDKLEKFGRFYLESISSVTTGNSFAVISKRSDVAEIKNIDETVGQNKQKDSELDMKPSVVTLVTNFKSLDNIPVPSNITYIIIDQEGTAIFHKNKSKILQENVIEEMNNNFSLTNAIYGRNERIFKANYEETHYRVLVKPIGNMPIYLLVLMDESAQKINDAQVLSLAAMFIILMFIIFAFQIGYFTLIDKDYTSKTKVKRLVFRTIWPNPSKTHRYLFLNIYIIVSLLIYIIGDMYDNVILTYSFFSLLITVNLFILRRFKSFKSIYSSVKYSIYFIVVLTLGFVLAFASQIHYIELYLFILFLILSAAAVYFSFGIKKSRKPHYYKLIFNTWIFLFIIALSVGPAFSFFSRAYNYEKLLYVQNTQYDLANNIVKNGFLLNDNEYQNYDSINSYFTIGTIDTTATISSYSFSSENEDQLIKNIRFKLNGDSKRISAFQFENSSRNSIFWKDSSYVNTTLYYQYNKKNVLEDVTNKTNSYLTITSEQIHLDPKEILSVENNSFKGKVFVVLFGSLLFALGLFHLISYYTRTIFLLGMIPSQKNRVGKMIKASSHLYIISPPYVGISHFLKTTLNEDECQFINTRYTALNFIKDSNHDLDIEIDSSKKTIIVYDNGKKEPEELRKKFLLVGQIKKEYFRPDSKIEKIIFVTQVTPQQITSYYKDEFNRLEDRAIVANYFDVLGDFVTTYFPMRKYEGSKSEIIDEGYSEEQEEVVSIGNSKSWMELHNGDMDMEDALLNMQNKDQLYFYALWTSLEKREKFLLYDLAQDGLVNYRNMDVIYNLLNREYIHYKGGRLQMFGTEFSNFILTIVDKDEALELEEELKESGKWASLRLPLFTIIGGILVFIFLTQQEVLNQVIGWATAAFALLPILAKLMVGLPFLNKGSKGKAGS